MSKLTLELRAERRPQLVLQQSSPVKPFEEGVASDLQGKFDPMYGKYAPMYGKYDPMFSKYDPMYGKSNPLKKA